MVASSNVLPASAVFFIRRFKSPIQEMMSSFGGDESSRIYWCRLSVQYITCWGPLKYDDQHVLVDEGFVHLNDIRVVQLLEKSNLLQASLSFLLRHLKNLERQRHRPLLSFGIKTQCCIMTQKLVIAWGFCMARSV